MESRYGIEVTAISPTNEPDYEVSYESMNTTPSELSSILINLNARLSNSGLDNINIVSPNVSGLNLKIPGPLLQIILILCLKIQLLRKLLIL